MEGDGCCKASSNAWSKWNWSSWKETRGNPWYETRNIRSKDVKKLHLCSLSLRLIVFSTKERTGGKREKQVEQAMKIQFPVSR